MPADGWVFDLVTLRCRNAAARRARARAGWRRSTASTMLVEQAADSFQLLFGADAAARPRRRADGEAAAHDHGSRSPGRSAWASRPSRRCSPRPAIPVFDADAEVRAMQGPGGTLVDAIEARFPGTTRDGAVDRDAAGARVLGDRDAARRAGSDRPPRGASRARARFIVDQRRRAGAAVRHSLVVRNRRRRRVRQGHRRLRAGRRPARAGARRARA